MPSANLPTKGKEEYNDFGISEYDEVKALSLGHSLISWVGSYSEMGSIVPQLPSAKSTVERETKFTVGAGFQLPPLKGSPLPAKILISVYYDTPDLRLARAQITLRHRTQGGKGA